MPLIIACFTEAHHNPVAAFLAAGITLFTCMGAYGLINSTVRSVQTAIQHHNRFNRR